ncbi:hypothetical protein C8F01DRAFT_1155458 [Mycena amicta]|nr:hypothetical protein C8F01DRAFT_1155458 [Mycena amicta]
MPSQRVFVTGASGFLGSHVVLQLLEKGYHVRAAARGAKAEQLQATYADAGYRDHFEVVKIADIANDQFPEALVGVDALMHLATPMPGQVDPAEQLQGALDGTLNIIVQAEKAGVKNMVVTSSIATVKNPEGSWTDKDWNPVTKEFALTGGNKMATYGASKKFAELALWEWAEKYPHVEVATLNPPFFYGPFTAQFTTGIPSTPNFGVLSTNLLIYNLLFPDGTFPSNGTQYIDVRDAAAAHIRALDAPPTAQVGRKRIVLSSPTGWPLQKVLEYIAEKRPALTERLLNPSRFPEQPVVDALALDFTRVEAVLGMKATDFRTTEETYLDTVDALVQIENGWREAGNTIRTPDAYS